MGEIRGVYKFQLGSDSHCNGGGCVRFLHRSNWLVVLD